MNYTPYVKQAIEYYMDQFKASYIYEPMDKAVIVFKNAELAVVGTVPNIHIHQMAEKFKHQQMEQAYNQNIAGGNTMYNPVKEGLCGSGAGINMPAPTPPPSGGTIHGGQGPKTWKPKSLHELYNPTKKEIAFWNLKVPCDYCHKHDGHYTACIHAPAPAPVLNYETIAVQDLAKDVPAAEPEK